MMGHNGNVEDNQSFTIMKIDETTNYYYRGEKKKQNRDKVVREMEMFIESQR